ncbi:MAG TPA: hypothetical protein VFY12_10435 [Arenimonas sp.]|nr:hypothetical protein [Arenimonas sp.]
MPVRLDQLVLLAVLAAGSAQATSQYEYINRVDRDGDGFIVLGEYLDWMSRAFHDMDRNGDGVLDPHEQLIPDAKRVTLAEFHTRLSGQFHKQDVDNDGRLSAKEYLAPPR